MYTVNAVNENLVFAAGASGALFKTTTGGSKWDFIYTNTQNAIGGISFANEEFGWICGREGMIKKSTNGGNTWADQNSNTSNILQEIKFIDLET